MHWVRSRPVHLREKAGNLYPAKWVSFLRIDRLRSWAISIDWISKDFLSVPAIALVQVLLERHQAVTAVPNLSYTTIGSLNNAKVSSFGIILESSFDGIAASPMGRDRLSI